MDEENELSTVDMITDSPTTVEDDSSTSEGNVVQDAEPVNCKPESSLDVDNTDDGDSEIHWVIPRDNCNRQIIVSKGITRNLGLTFGGSGGIGGVSGQCQITIFGPKDNLLALLISKIQFSENNKEVLRVVTSSPVNYIMKEFRLNDVPQSLLLPDTNQVFLIFSYNNSSLEKPSNSTFHLQVFPYKIEENNIQQDLYEPGLSLQADQVYFTTEQPIWWGPTIPEI